MSYVQPRRLLWGAAILALVAALLLPSAGRNAATAAEPGVEVVYVATGGDYPDALAGSTLAALTGAPLLLVTRESIPPDTRAELERLVPGSIVIFGGTGAINAAVQAELDTFTTGPVTRVFGANRFATAAEISKILPSKVVDSDQLDGLDSTDFVQQDQVRPPNPIAMVGSTEDEISVSGVTTYTDHPGATMELTVPDGYQARIILRTTAETLCNGTAGWCSLRVLMDGTEMAPAEGSQFAVDSAVGDDQYEAHAFDRWSDGLVGPGTYTFQLQYLATDAATTFWVDNWTLFAEAHLEEA